MFYWVREYLAKLKNVSLSVFIVISWLLLTGRMENKKKKLALIIDKMHNTRKVIELFFFSKRGGNNTFLIRFYNSFWKNTERYDTYRKGSKDRNS